MGDSVEYILEQRAKKDASIREALALYPDLCFDGDYLSARSLKPEDCDTIVCIDQSDGTRLRAGKSVGRVVVLLDWPSTKHVASMLYSLSIHDKEAYRTLVQFVAKGSL